MNKNGKKTEQAETDTQIDTAMEMLVGKKEIARELKMSERTLVKYFSKYPFESCGISGKIMGSWRVDRADVYRWWRWVQSQELRHPEARRLRPQEPPEIAGIVGR